MRAAKHHRIHRAQIIRVQQFQQIAPRLLVGFLLHQFHQAGAGQRNRPFAVARIKLLKLFQPQGHRRGQHQDASAVAQGVGRLKRGFHAQYRQVIRLPQFLRGDSGRGVAGNHHRLDVIREQMCHHARDARHHLFARLRAIGGVQRVAEIQKILLRQFPAQGAEGADAAVKHADGVWVAHHPLSSLFCFFFIIRRLRRKCKSRLRGAEKAVIMETGNQLYDFRMRMRQDAPRIFAFWLTRMKCSAAALR